MKPCPECGKTAQVNRVIYYGLPHYLCDCNNVVFGFWSWFTQRLPFNGEFLEYHNATYIEALWVWLTWEDE